MKKRLFTLLSAVFMLFFTEIATNVYAAEEKVYVEDMAGKLSSSELVRLDGIFRDISEEYGCDIAAVIANGYFSSVSAAAGKYYLNGGYTDSGMILMIDYLAGEYNFQAMGGLEDTLNSDAYDYIEDAILPYLEQEDFSGALEIFAEKAEEMLELESKGQEYREPFNWLASAIIALGIGFLAAFLITSSMKKQLNNVQNKVRAHEYVKQGSLNVTESRDLFLYHTVIRTPRPKSNSQGGTGRSIGSSGGGRSGSFR